MNNRITNFLKYLSLHGVSPKSLKYYKSDLLQFLNWTGTRKVSQELIQEYISEIRLVTSTSTLNRRLSTLRSYSTFLGFKKTVKSSWQDKILSKFESKPKLQIFLNKLFFSRPNWYKRYHSYPLANYIHIAILVLFTSLSGYALYDQIFKNPSSSSAFPTALTRPNRYLSFQGRLTDNLGNPKTVATDMVFQLYSVSTGGVALWNSGTCSITPDSDGIFSTLLGSSCGAEIAATVFSENASIWLGATMGADAEATPRVQIATVAYALNSETLQGYPAGTGTSTIPYINSSGSLVLANASPTIQSTSGTFAVEGLAMTLTTPNTSNGVITVNPDGVGTLNLTFEGAAAGLSANGFVNAVNANITSGALYGGTVASAASGYNFVDFQSGVSPTSKFSISSTGQITSASGLTIGTTSLSETTSPTDSGAYIVGANDEFAYSASTNVQGVLNDLDAQIGAIVGGTSGLWTDGGTVTYLTDTADDFAIGGSTLAASMFGIDESAGNFYFGYDNSANPTLNFEATDADAGEFGFNTNDAFYFSNANVGIGTTAPGTLLTLGTGTPRVSVDTTDASDSKVLTLTGGGDWGNNRGANLGLYGNENGTTGYKGRVYIRAGNSYTSGLDGSISFNTSSAGDEKMIINYAGNVGIGTTEPDKKLSVWGGDGSIWDPTDLGTESLTNGALTAGTSWTQTTDCALAADAATCTYAAGTASTVQQASGTLAVAGVGSRWYKFVYTVSGITGTPAASITTAFASSSTALTLTAGTQTTYFKSATTPTDFIITTTLTAGQAFTLDTFSLKEVQGGDLALGGILTGGGTTGLKVLANGNVGIGTTAPTQKLDVWHSEEIASGNQYKYPLILTTYDSSGGLWQGTGTGIKFHLKASDADLDVAEIVGASPSTLSITDGVLLFRTAKSGTIATKMILDADGKLGIGDTTPDAFLEVLGTTEQLRLTHTDGTVDSRFTVDASGNLTIDNTGTKTIIADDLQITGGDILDSNGNESIRFGTTASAVDEATLTNAAANGTVTFAATGGDTDIAFSIDSKGADALNLNGTATGDVNLAGGYGGTGCTVTNSNGNLSCNGTITGTFAGTLPWSSIIAPTANLSLAHAGYTTAFTFDSVTTADAFALSSSSLTTGTILDLSSTSTAGGASGLSKVLDITRSGTNSNASHTAYGLYSAVTNTGTTSTNVGGYFSASGATNNYGLLVANGNVGIGTTAPQGILHVASSGTVDDLILNQATTTNLVTNPSFETNTTGWTSNGNHTGSRIITDSVFGSSSAEVVATASNNMFADGSYRLAPQTLLNSTQYTVSFYAKSVSGNTTLRFTTFGGSFYTFALTTNWQRFTQTFTTASNYTTGSTVYFGIDGAGTFRLDGVQIEQLSSATPYTDGSFGSGYAWTGTVHGSTSTRTAGAVFAYQTINSAGGLGAVGRSTTPALRIEQDGTGPIASFFTPSAEVVRIDSNGNVGIGTTGPGNTLELKNALATGQLRMGDGTNYWELGRDNVSTGDFVIRQGTSEKARFTTNGFGIGYATTGTAALAINGNVGIGTTAPAGKLNVVYNSGIALPTLSATAIGIFQNTNAAGDYAKIDLLSGNTGRDYLNFGDTDDEDVGNIFYDHSNNYMAFTTNATQQMTILSSGNVGIGTTGPAHKLDILTGNSQGDNAGSIQIKSSSGTNVLKFGIDGTNNYAELRAYTPGVGDNSKLVLQPYGGNVGIGDTSPDAKLEALGTTEQLRLTYTDGTVDSRFTVDSSGNLTIDNTGTQTIIADDLQIQGGDLTVDDTTFNLVNTTATTLNIGGAATTMNIGPTGSGASSIVLSGGSADTGCTLNGATGALTCSGTIAGTIPWSEIDNPTTSLTLAMGVNPTTFGWTPTGALNAFTMNIVNNGGSATTQNGLVINNAIAGAFTDVITEDLLLIQQLDTTTAGTTVVTNGIKIDSAGNSAMTNGMTITNSAGNLTTGITIADTAGGTLTTGIAITGTVTNAMDAGNFPIINIGNAATDFDTSGGLTLAGNLVVQGTTGLTFNTGAGGDITFALGEKIDNDVDGTLALTATTTALSGNLKVTGGNILNSAGTANIIFSGTPTTTANTLSASNWLVENTANLGQAALMVNQTKAGDLFTASASGTPIVTMKQATTAKANIDLLQLTNHINAADMDTTRTSILFNQWYYDATTPAIADAGRLTVGAETDWTSTATTQDAFLSFDTALDGTLAEKMRITSGGLVGIGTTAPAMRLDVLIGGSNGAFAARILNEDANGYGLNVLAGDNNEEILKLEAADGTNRHSFFAGGDVYLAQGAGSVGIGTTAPQSTLDLGDATLGRSIVWGGSTGTGWTATIGTSYSSADLNVLSGIKLNTASDAYAYSYTGTYGVAGMELDFGAGDIHFFTQASAAHTAGTAYTATDAMTIKSDGKVGIGTTAPSYLLEVDRAQAGNNIVQLGGSAVSTGNTLRAYRNRSSANTDSPLVDLINDAATDDQLLFRLQQDAPADIVNIFDGTTEVFTILDGGNVGIGTTAPNTNLSVYNANESTTLTNFTQALTNAGIEIQTNYTANAYTPGIFWSTTDNNATKPKAGIWMQETGTGTYLNLGTSNAYATGITNQALVIDPTGNVGIGTTGPNNKLHIYDTGTTPRIQLSASSAYGSGYISYYSDGATNNNDILGLGNNAYNQLVIKYGGNVGIGDTTPSYALDVNGTFAANFPATYNYSKALCFDGTGYSDVEDCTGTPAADYMEFYPTTNNVEASDLVSISDEYTTTTTGQKIAKLIKTTSPNQSKIIGVISNPDDAGDFNSIGYNIEATDNPMPVALNGRVLVKIVDENGPISKGDYITSSSTPGFGMKALIAGNVVGQALEDWDSTSGKDKVLIFIKNTWYDPDLAINDVGDVTLSGNSIANYAVTTPTGITEKIGAFASATVAKLVAGIGSFKQVETNLISPVANTDLIVDLQPDDSQSASKLVIKGEDNKEVASIDANGQIKSEELIVNNDATISGTLYANNIESDKIKAIEDLLSEVENNQTLLTEAANWNTSTSLSASTSANFSELIADNLFVTGNASMTSLFVTDNFTAKNINSLTEPLGIQSLATAPLEIMAGKIKIDTNGNAYFSGNVEVAGNLKLDGNIVIANNIDPTATESAVASVSGEINSNATAGKALLPAGLTELKIKNPKSNANSLIYVTPVTSTQNKVLYVKSKDVGEFTIGFNEAIDTDVEFNWWIIELENNL